MHEIRTTIFAGGPKPATPVARKSRAKAEGDGLGDLTRIAIPRKEARVTDQRGEHRLGGRIGQMILNFRRRQQLIRVINTSTRGALIEADIEPRIGEEMQLQFTEDSKTRCIVRWVRDSRFGVEFVDEAIIWDADSPAFRELQLVPSVDAPEPSLPAAVSTPVREPRQKLLRKAVMLWGGITIPVRVRNISRQGAQVDSGQSLRPGCEVELNLGEVGFQMAEVRWAKDGQIGLRFADNFDLAQLGPAAMSAAPSPDMLMPDYIRNEDSAWAGRRETLSITDLKRLDRED